MVMKCTTVCLMALALLGSFCDAQWGGGTGYKPSKPVYPNPGQPPRPDPVNPVPPGNQQEKQTFEKPLTWKYPADPQPEPAVEVPFELRHPVPASTVAVECRERDAHMEVKKDMFGKGQFINPADLTLGNCGAVAEDTAAQVLIFETELQGCLSTLMMTEDALIYSFTLNYNPKPMGMGLVVRTSKAAVVVECHYPRKHNVSSLPLDPLWIPFSAVKVSEEFLYFTMKLMTDDWQYERPSYQYFLGDFINIEAVVKQYFHVPLRIYVDSCVATLSPDLSSNPRYAFIDNYGCMLDAKLTGSESRFMARSADNKLQFQLEAFKFQGADSGMLYITCHLKATSTAIAIDSEHKACSYINGWEEASGANAACGSCESGGTGAGLGSTSGGIGAGRGSTSGGIGAGRGSTSGGIGAGRGSTSGGIGGGFGSTSGVIGAGRGSTSGGMGAGHGHGSTSGGMGAGRGSTSGGMGAGHGHGSTSGGMGAGHGHGSTSGGMGAGRGHGSTSGGMGAGHGHGSTSGGMGVGHGHGSTSGGMGAGHGHGSTSGGMGAGRGHGSTSGGIGAGRDSTSGGIGAGHGSTSGGIGAGTTTGTWGGSGTPVSGRKIRDVSESEIFEWEGDVTLGPIPIGEKVVS